MNRRRRPDEIRQAAREATVPQWADEPGLQPVAPDVCPTCRTPKATGNGSWLVTDREGRALYYHPCPECTTDPERLAWLRRQQQG